MRLLGIAEFAPTRARRAAIDESRLFNGRVVRFASRLDAETEAFEERLARRLAESSMEEVECTPASLPLQQRHAWLKRSDKELRLLQLGDADGRPAMQIALSIERSRYVPWAAQACAFKMGRAVTPEDEQVGLEALRELVKSERDIASLRLQPRRLDARSLRDFEERARRAGFRLRDPESLTRTLVLDLRASEEELLASLPQKTRRKVRAPKRDATEIRVLDDDRYLDACRRAALASVRRTGGAASRVPWTPTLSLARERPELVRILGLFDRTRPDEALAFVVGQRHGVVAEYASAGSIDDPALRKLPFNYFLLWELARWARDQGSRYLDLGGVTEGGHGDPLAGISAFKRHFCRNEVEVGREMIAELHPAATFAVSALRSISRLVGT